MALTVHGGNDADSFTVGGGNVLANIRDAVTINGEGGINVLVIDDADDAAGIIDVVFPPGVSVPYVIQDTYALTSTTFRKTQTTGFVEPTNEVATPALDFLGMAEITLLGSGSTGQEFAEGFASTINVDTVAGGRVNIRAGGGNDQVVVGGMNHDLDVIRGRVDVDGGIGENILTLDDQNGVGVAAGFPFVITDTAISRQINPNPQFPYAKFAGVEYGNVAQLTFQASNAADVIYVNSTSADSELRLVGNNGNDVFLVTAPPTSPIVVSGGAPSTSSGDALVVTGTTTSTVSFSPSLLDTNGGPVVVNGVSISSSGLETVNLQNFDSLSVVTPRSYDLITIETTSSNSGTIHGFSGHPALLLPFSTLTFRDVRQVTLDTASRDLSGFAFPPGPSQVSYPPFPNDTVDVMAGALNVVGLERFEIRTGYGANTVNDFTLIGGGPTTAVLAIDGTNGATLHNVYGVADRIEVEHRVTADYDLTAFGPAGQVLHRVAGDFVVAGLFLRDPQDEVQVTVSGVTATVNAGGNGRQRVAAAGTTTEFVPAVEGRLGIRTMGNMTLDIVDALLAVEVEGGSGDDVIQVAKAVFSAIHGGGGNNVLRLTRADEPLDLTELTPARLSEIKQIDLVNGGSNVLTLTVADVLEHSGASATLRVRAEEDDRVYAGGGWSVSGVETFDGERFSRFVQGQATLLVSNLLIGDLTGDQVVGRSDAAVLARHYGQGMFAKMRDGDLNGDGAVDLNDLGLLQSQVGRIGIVVFGTAPANAPAATRAAAAVNRPAVAVSASKEVMADSARSSLRLWRHRLRGLYVSDHRLVRPQVAAAADRYFADLENASARESGAGTTHAPKLHGKRVGDRAARARSR